MLPGMICSFGARAQQKGSDTLIQPIKQTVSPLTRTIKANAETLQSQSKQIINRHLLVPRQRPAAKRPDSIPLQTKANTPDADPARTDPDQENEVIVFIERRNCKATIATPVLFSIPVVRERVKPPAPPLPPPRVPFLQVHGNIMYNVNYYSNIDTPYNEQNIYQHTVQTYLDVVVKGQYPLRIYLTNRFTNSNLFRNFNDLNFSYNNNTFKQQLREKVSQRFLSSIPSPASLDSLQQLMKVRLDELKQLDGWIKNPAILQKMVEAKERAMRKAKTGIDSLIGQSNIDSLQLMTEYKEKKEKADSLRQKIVALQQKINTSYQKSRADVQRIRQAIDRINDPESLRKLMEELKLSDTMLPKGYRQLMAIRSLSLGRSVVNYSELSAKNISINGVQAEYNPSSYYAIAVGKVDYRFRDFIVQSPRQQGQYLTVLRYGKGLKDGNNIIFSWYAGRRQLYNAGTVDSTTTSLPSTGLMGLTIEGNYRLTENILVTAEVAKSTVPGYSGDLSDKPNMATQLLKMKDRTNEAYSLKVHAFFPKTLTRFKGSFKKLGANFQSFSTFTDGTTQTSWSAGVSQLFFKRQLDLAVSANTNDFSNPFIGSRYKSTTVFKSIQATFRKRKWPVISAGYFPSSQITKMGEGLYQENLFYTLSGNVTHTYNIRQVLMNTAVVYTQFYNKGSDSGFVYFNTKNLMMSHSIYLQQLTLMANAAAAYNNDYRLYTLEGRTQYVFNTWLTLGAGVKYNHQTHFDLLQWGYSGEAILTLGKLGRVQVSADKGFLPGIKQQLVSNNTGRLTYFKTF